jgi:hypothetical protein
MKLIFHHLFVALPARAHARISRFFSSSMGVERYSHHPYLCLALSICVGRLRRRKTFKRQCTPRCFEIFSALYFLFQTFSQDKKWRVLEVTPSVPRDTYRIRTLNGTALHLEPESGVISLENIKQGKHQEVRVVSSAAP